VAAEGKPTRIGRRTIAMVDPELARHTAERDEARAHDARGAAAARRVAVVQQKMATLGQLTAGIAHEIKNPLSFVNNFAGLSVELLDELKAAAAPVSRPSTPRRALRSTRPSTC
jgi:C4-dicarboxylate-specific signal transduction histidine kinase